MAWHAIVLEYFSHRRRTKNQALTIVVKTHRLGVLSSPDYVQHTRSPTQGLSVCMFNLHGVLLEGIHRVCTLLTELTETDCGYAIRHCGKLHAAHFSFPLHSSRVANSLTCLEAKEYWTRFPFPHRIQALFRTNSQTPCQSPLFLIRPLGCCIAVLKE